MKSLRSLCTVACSAIFAAMIAGCGSDVAELDISPDVTTLGKGDTMQFKVIAKYADGSVEDVTNNPLTEWNTSDVENATVSTSGLVTARDEGTVSIEVKYEDVTASEDILITP
ncbi:MAG TPA: Ig-like domain-containing protein [Polyangium sp.]|nr:Ig-like domain-containing protein [Polyangium sp.]